MAWTFQMDSASGFPACEFVAVFLFAVTCPFGYTAHDLTAGLLFTWTCICLQVAVFTGAAMSVGRLNKPHVCITNYVHLMVLWVYKFLFNFL
jgi:hypothetical protein